MDKMIRVVFYIRVSTEEQKLHGLSLKTQRMKLEEYAEKHNYKVVGIYADEGVSGRKPIKKRPQLQQMLNDAKKGMFDLILFIKLDRYFRSVAEYHDCQRILDEHDIKWTATEEKYDLTTANGRAFVNMKLTIAELEADTTSERIVLVNDYKVKQGLVVTGRPCYGWKIAKTVDGRKINVIDDTKEAEVRELLDLIEIHQSFSKAVKIVQEKYDVNTYQKTYRKLVSNTWLYGKYRDNENYCEAYITKERFDRIQKIIKKNTRIRENSYEYLFSTLVTCDFCGSNMSGNYNIKSNGQPYFAYRCNHRMRPNVKCFKASHSIGERTIEKYLLANMNNIINDYIVNAEVSASKVVKPKKSKRESIIKEMERLNTMYQKGRIDEEKYDEEYDRLNNQLKKENDEEIVYEKGANLEELNKLLQMDIKEIYNSLNREHKKAFWQNLIKEIFVDNRKSPKVRRVVLNDRFKK